MMPSLPIVEFYKIVGCVNAILDSSIRCNSVVFQSGFGAVLEFPVVLREYKPSIDTLQKLSYDFYVADLRKTSVQLFLENLEKHESFNPKAGYVFIGDRPTNSDISALLNHHIANFVFLEIETDDILTVFPYENGEYRNYSTQLQKIGKCQDGGVHLEPTHSLLSNKPPTLWKRSKLTLLYGYEAPYSMDTKGHKRGIEMDLLQLILDKMDMDVVYLDFRSPGFNMSELKNKGGYDIEFGNLAISMSRDDLTVPYSCDSTYWFVPQPDVIPKWKLALMVFEAEVNAAMMLSMICVCLLLASVGVLMHGVGFRGSFLHQMWQIQIMLFEQSVKFKMNYWTSRILYFLILQYFVIINSTFKAKYTYFMSGPIHDTRIETLEGVMEEGLKLGTTKFLVDIYKTTPKVYEYIQKNFVECDTGPACFNRSAHSKDLAVLKPYRKVAYIRDQFMDRHGHYLNHRIRPSVLTLCNTFRVPKGHPMFPLLDRYVHLLMQHGFVNKVIAKYDQIVKSRRRSGPWKNPRLRFNAVKGPVFAMVIGILIGSVVFLLEKIVYARKKRQ